MTDDDVIQLIENFAFDAAVGPVAHPARNAEPLGRLPREPAEADPLHDSAHDPM